MPRSYPSGSFSPRIWPFPSQVSISCRRMTSRPGCLRLKLWASLYIKSVAYTILHDKIDLWCCREKCIPFNSGSTRATPYHHRPCNSSWLMENKRQCIRCVRLSTLQEWYNDLTWGAVEARLFEWTCASLHIKFCPILILLCGVRSIRYVHLFLEMNGLPYLV